MKNLIKEHSLYLTILAIAECILSTIATLSFVYTDTLTYNDSALFTEGVSKLLQGIYHSTWWALILLLLFFIALFTIMSIIYKKQEYHVIAIGCWIEMFILSLNFTKPILDVAMNLLLFAPIFVLNIIAYKKEKEKLHPIEVNIIQPVKEEVKKITKKVTKKKTSK